MSFTFIILVLAKEDHKHTEMPQELGLPENNGKNALLQPLA